MGSVKAWGRAAVVGHEGDEIVGERAGGRRVVESRDEDSNKETAARRIDHLLHN